MEVGIQKYYWGVFLSQAAYGDYTSIKFDDGGYGVDIEVNDVLTSNGADFSSEQADVFQDRFELVEHQHDDNTGFRASLFFDTTENEYTFAIAGTETNEKLLDIFFADLVGIAYTGKASGQIGSMFAFYDDLLTRGVLDSDTRINVVGHSLGGHLATIFAIYRPLAINHAYTYNGAGTGAGGQGAAEIQLEELLGKLPDSFSGGAIEHDRITNLYAEAGPELIAGTGVLYGEVQPLYIEDNGLLANHSINFLSDSLAVYQIFDQIQNGISAENVSSILAATSPVTDERTSLEEMLTRIGKLFGQGLTWSEGDADQHRDDLYRNISTLEPLLASFGGTLEVTSLAGHDAATLLALANPDVDGALAYRYAIQELNPFAVTGNDGLYTTASQGGYIDWDNFSLDYWADRSSMLYWKLRSNTEDPVFRGQAEQQYNYWVESGQEHPVLYRDLRSGYEVRVGGNSTIFAMSDTGFEQRVFGDNSNANVITGGNQRDRIYGGSLSDTLTGGEENDYLEGGAGNDTLEGGSGADILHGGAGNDTYAFQSGDGLDFIYDSDGAGKIIYDGVTLTGGKEASPGVYVSDDGNFTYLFDIASGAAGALVIRGPDGNLVVNDYTDGDLGITLNLDQSPAAPPPETGLEITGDFEPKDFDPGDGVEYHYDDLGNRVQDPEKPAATADVLNGSAGNDHITGGQDDDRLFGYSGDDHLEGGSDRDRLDGGEGADLLEGGAGTDILSGGVGDDRLFAASVDDWNTIFDSGLTPAGVDRDWLSGGEGDDLLVGSTGDNGLSGGAGSDLIAGGAGADSILGDADWLATDFDWSYSRNGSQRVYSPVTGEQNPPGGDADTIYGGGGDDFVLGQAGDDIIFGDEGADHLVGNEGADTLYGGTGDDEIFGDDASTDFSSQGDDLIDGGAGNDYLVGHAGADRIEGGEGDDILFGDAGLSQIPLEWHGDDHLSGGAGNDTLYGHGGADTLLGGPGEDRLYGQQDNDLIRGGAERDLLFGGEGSDRLFGDEGDDQLEGNDGGDLLDGGAGADELTGGDGNDTLLGGAGDDELYANAGDDALLGGAGNDLLQGNDGNDYLIGGAGDDGVVGGAGDDTYIYNRGDGVDTFFDPSGRDVVYFGPGIDLLSSSVFLSGGFLIFQFSATDVLYIQDNSIERYVFADGTALAPEQIIEYATYIGGGNGNETIQGTDTDDVILMGAGDDQYEGRGGDDIYVYNPGDGHDVIIDTSGAVDALVLGQGIDPASMTVSQQAFDLRIDFAPGDSVTIRNWFIGQQIEVFDFYNGVQIMAPTMELLSGAPLLVGDATSEIIVGGPEDEIFRGNGGDDTLLGGGGNDDFVYRAGDGLDRIETTATGSNDRLIFGEGIDPDHTIAQITVSGGEEILEIRFLDARGRVMEGQGIDIVMRPAGVSPDEQYDYGIEGLVFSGGTSLTPAELILASVNQSPVLSIVLPDHTLDEDTAFEFSFESHAFTDPDAIGYLTYAAAQSDGTALPAWLSFNPYTRLFSGTPANEDVGVLDITVTATDGRGAQAADTFSITVNNTNDAPVTVTPLQDQTAQDGQDFSLAIPEETFSDPDMGDNLAYTASLADGQSLPGWLAFDPVTLVLTGTPGETDIGVLDVRITVSDLAAATVSDDFLIEVQPAEPEPPNVITGVKGDNVLTGSDGVDIISAQRGDDVIYGLGGDDAIQAGRGMDTVYAGSGNDQVNAGSGNDVVYGEAGDDVLDGGSGDDLLSGGAGADQLNGQAGDDTLLGGAGEDSLHGGDADDYLEGGAGSDNYYFGRGDDTDTLVDYSSTDATASPESQSMDRVWFGEDIAMDQLWFERVKDDLQVSIIGTRDEISIAGWYDGDASQVEEFHTADGSYLVNTRVEQLVSAMASFHPPHQGELNLPTAYQDELQPVIAQAWQAA